MKLLVIFVILAVITVATARPQFNILNLGYTAQDGSGYLCFGSPSSGGYSSWCGTQRM